MVVSFPYGDTSCRGRSHHCGGNHILRVLAIVAYHPWIAGIGRHHCGVDPTVVGFGETASGRKVAPSLVFDPLAPRRRRHRGRVGECVQWPQSLRRIPWEARGELACMLHFMFAS